MIHLDKVSLNLNGKCVLEDISFSISPGESILLAGNSGAGKSTILKLILGLLKPTSGNIYVFGKNVTEMSEHQLMKIRQQLGIVFQEGALFDSLNVQENVSFFLRENLKLTAAEIQERVLEKLHFLGLQRFLDYFPSELSGGMKKRVAVARAVVANPKGMLYDEPTAGLDPVSARRVVGLISNLQEKFRMTSLVVTHEVHYFIHAVQRMLMLKDGHIVYDGEPMTDIHDMFEDGGYPRLAV
ncbi:ATP-binding cassette domain-containing protein [Candidatus Saccharibacteria bacterium]|nr:ATP-binding cassette domain-containing protein [Calditrichia bacterium]NIV98723.1 ATP-binding cassette domain-containing protein [Candidatus Saccharibacteria bacterium]NIW78979.1 ATP-binding cassette domain-containing protein [Calditrichia bacterium]